jgi:hypothetical protein
LLKIEVKKKYLCKPNTTAGTSKSLKQAHSYAR